MAVLSSRPAPNRCSPKPSLEARPLLTGAEAVSLQRLFKLLASGSRLRLLHALARAGEVCVSDLARETGMTQQAVSNQLRRLSDTGIVASRRQGLRVYYAIADSCVVQLIGLGLCLMEDSRQRAERPALPVPRAGAER